MLDVVYNHNTEGEKAGPTLSFGGLDAAAYYHLTDERATSTSPAPETL